MKNDVAAITKITKIVMSPKLNKGLADKTTTISNVTAMISK